MRMTTGIHGGALGVATIAATALLACAHDVLREDPVTEPRRGRTPVVRVVVLGDFGLRSIPQRLVARAVRRAHAARPFDLALLLGDNLYYCGPDPGRPGAETCRFAEDGATVAAGATQPDDPIFRVIEKPLEGMRLAGGAPLPIFLALGNHDIGWGSGCDDRGLPPREATRRRACLSVARRTPAWTMPGRHYVIDRGPLRIVVLDTNVVVADYGGFTLEQEIAFVRQAVAPCGERICVLAGHHPPAAMHDFRRHPSSFPGRMARLLAAADGRAPAFFAGHLHDLQHLSLGALDVFVSGSTAMGDFSGFRYRTPAIAQSHFASSAWGYAVLEVDAEGYAVRFHDLSGEPLHCCEAARGGPCRTVRC
jgi:hypothetical protein